MKTIFTLCASFFVITGVSAQVSGPNCGLTFSTSPIAGFSQSWTSTGNAGSSNDSYAVFGDLQNSVGAYSDYILVTNFGFNIPPATVIEGIAVEVERSDPGARTSDYSIRIIREGVLGSTDKSTGTPYPATDQYITYGSSTDLWGESWSFKNISNNDFGIAIAAQRNALGGITGGQIDNIRITVYYNFTTLPLSLTSFTAAKNDKTVTLAWSTSAESNMDQYIAERSEDGRSFYAIASIPASNQSQGNYLHTDKSPLTGTSYYRLKMLDKTGGQTFSKIIPVHFATYNIITLSPSPWTKGNDLTIQNPSKEHLIIQFYKADGKIVGKAVTATNDVPVPVLSDIKGLIYFKVTDEKNQLRGSGSLLIY